MPTIVIDTKNKKQEKIIQAFLDTLEVSYYTEAQEEQALYNAMKKGKKTKLLSEKKNNGFLKVVNKLRTKAKNNSPSLEDITKEVEIVRTKRYAKSR